MRWLLPRFIPACAGNSKISAIDAAGGAVHPRVCGEQMLLSSPASTRAGSSPRVRGTATGGEDAIVVHRFIPACAGNSI